VTPQAGPLGGVWPDLPAPPPQRLDPMVCSVGDFLALLNEAVRLHLAGTVLPTDGQGATG